ncbi:MAG: hypothetical protein FJ150_10035 [Euryarchaeota archaeon]|nr:hypothetical protein [Euryarchaeota archaeon]
MAFPLFQQIYEAPPAPLTPEEHKKQVEKNKAIIITFNITPAFTAGFILCLAIYCFTLREPKILSISLYNFHSESLWSQFNGDFI